MISKLKQNILANLIGRAWSGLASVIFIPLYIKFIGIEAYGLIGIYMMLQGVFAFLDMGLSTTLNRELARCSGQLGKDQEMRDLLRTLEVIYWGTGVIIGLAILLLAPFIADHWIRAEKLPAVSICQTISIMAFLFMLQWPLSLYSSGMIGLQQQVLLNSVNVIMTTMRTVGCVIVLWVISPTIQAFFLWQIFICSVNAIVIALLLWRNLPCSENPPTFRMNALLCVWRFAAGMTAVQVTGFFVGSLDKVILSKIISLKAFGYYSLAVAMASGLYIVCGALFTALFPSFSKLVAQDASDSLRILYHNGCQAMSVLTFPIAAIIAFFSRDILYIWTKDPLIVQNVHLLLCIVTIAAVLNILLFVPQALVLAHGWVSLPLYNHIIAIIFLTPLMILMAIHYGAVGTAAIWAMYSACTILITLAIIHRRLMPGDHWKWYLEDVCPPLIAALSIAGIGRWLLGAPQSIMASVVCLIIIFLAAQTASAYVTPVTHHWMTQSILTKLFSRERV